MVSPDDVRAELDRILASPAFVNADRLSRFVRFASEKALAGEGDSLKEYLLGTEVFDRGSDFDPRLDPIVRVEARRLRSKLQEYYEGPGQDNPIRVVFRKGSYAPSFEAAAPSSGTAIPLRARGWRWLWVPVLAVGLVAGVFALRSSVSPPPIPIVVMPAFNSQESDFADGVAEAVSAELSRNPRVHVLAWPLFLEYRQKNPTPDRDIGKMAKALGVDAVVFISVRRSEDRRRVSAILMKPELGWKQWAGEYERGLGDDLAVQREVARAIAEEVRGGLEKPR